MARLFELIDTRRSLPGFPRRRLWVEAGMPMLFGQGRMLIYVLDRYDACYMPYLIVRGCCGGHRKVLVWSMRCIDLTKEAGLVVIPRAIEYDRRERPLRCLLELMAVREGVAIA